MKKLKTEYVYFYLIDGGQKNLTEPYSSSYDVNIYQRMSSVFSQVTVY